MATRLEEKLRREVLGFETDPRRLNHVLERFCTQEVKRDREKTRHAREEVTRYVEVVLEKVKEIDGNFDFEPIRMGSDFQRVAVKSSSDFDILLVFKNFPPLTPGNRRYECPVGWSAIFFTSSSSASSWLGLHRSGDNVSSESIRASFSCCVSEAIARLRYSSIMTSSTHGPAVKLSIHPSPNIDTWEIDLVPARKSSVWPTEARRNYRWPARAVMDDVILDGTYLVAKLHKTRSDRNILWNISFCAAHNKIARLPDPGCKKESLRILKSLTKKEIGPPLNSYHLRNIWMHECEKYPDDRYWTGEKIGERFMGLLGSLRDRLQKGQCKDFFIQEIDLFDGLDKQHLSGLGNKVAKIERDPARYLI